MDPCEMIGTTEGRPDIDRELPISSLIASQIELLGTTRAKVARRMGYETKIAKGVRRLDALLAGDLRHVDKLRHRLAEGLSIELSVLDMKIEETRHVLRARDDRDYRVNFALHVVWKTVLSMPSPITIAAMAGVQRRLLWYPKGIEPALVSEGAVEFMPEGVPCYGKVTGFYVNYAPDCAVQFNRQGEPLEVLSRAIRPTKASCLM